MANLSADRRIQALLIAFSFGAFIEGASGFGTPVAICSALLMGLGFTPLYAAGLALIANTAPVAFGAIGTPILTLAAVTGLPAMALSAMAGRQLPFVSLIIPVWLVVTMSGWRGLAGVWPAVLVCGRRVRHRAVRLEQLRRTGAGRHRRRPALARRAHVFCRVWKPRESLAVPGGTRGRDAHAGRPLQRRAPPSAGRGVAVAAPRSRVRRSSAPGCRGSSSASWSSSGACRR